MADRECTLTTTNHGKPALLIDGYLFRVDRQSPQSGTTWRCTKRGCTARCKTDNDCKLIGSLGQHNGHAAKTVKDITVAEFRKQCKRQGAVDFWERPSKVMHRELHGQADEERFSIIDMGDLERVRKAMYSERRKQIMPQLPKNREEIPQERSSKLSSMQQTAHPGLKEMTCNKMFGGFQKVYSHQSSELKCTMKFGIYLPPSAEGSKVPVLYWLSGLTCTEQNFVTKAGAQKYAAEHGVIIVAPDTSPRGCGIEGEDDSYDFGTGAGFYIDATQEKWKNNYRMYSYITKELPALINSNFPAIPDKQSIFGHSMGGHGALVCALKNPGMYRSVSAFAPICNPTQCPWGKKAFSGYLGTDTATWQAYDAVCLLQTYNGPPLDILVDQGKMDNFFTEGQLLPEKLVEVCTSTKNPIVMRMQEGYDHSYFFIATFVEDHIKHHAKFLKA